MGRQVGSRPHRRALPGTRAPARPLASPPARCGGGERLHQGAARGARVTTQPPRAAGEDGEDAGTASSILAPAPPPSASPRPQTPRLFAPQPGRGPRRREEREAEKEGEREEEEVVWLSPGIRLGAGQGCGRRQLIRPRGSGRAGLGRGCSHSAHPGSGPPPSLAAQSPRGHRALTLRVGAARTLGEAQLPAGRTIRTLRMNDDSAAHQERARVTPASADANPPRALRAEPGRSGWLWGNLLGTGWRALGPTPIPAGRTSAGSRLGARDPGRKWTQPMVVDVFVSCIPRASHAPNVSPPVTPPPLHSMRNCGQMTSVKCISVPGIKEETKTTTSPGEKNEARATPHSPKEH
eukprot:bmy_02690T0